MSRLLKNLQALGALREALEPTPPPAPAGAEHVMVEIAPGVFRSVNRQRSAPAASRLLLELQRVTALRENLSGHFTRAREALQQPSRAPRNPNPKSAAEIPDASYRRQR